MAQTAATTPAYGVPRLDQREPEQLQAGPVLLQQRRPVDGVGDRGVLQHHRQDSRAARRAVSTSKPLAR